MSKNDQVSEDVGVEYPHRRNVASRTKEGTKESTNDKFNNNTNSPGPNRPARKSGRWSDVLQDIFDPVEVKIFGGLLAIRAAAFVIWTGGILYATYHVYLACEKYLGTFFRDPTMNPSTISWILGRGKDSTDSEWEMFLNLFLSRLWFWCGLFVVMSRIVQPAFPRDWKFMSTGLSFVMFWELIGLIPILFIVGQIGIYWIVAQTRRKSLLWIVTIIFIYCLNASLVQSFVADDGYGEYFFVISSAWNCCRCISFCYDVWEKVGGGSLDKKYFGNLVGFCLYLPLAISGPLVTYNNFERCIIHKDIEAVKRRSMAADFAQLVKTVLRLTLIALFSNFLLHVLYFRALTLSESVHRYLNLWAVCGTIYWLGQFFALKYKVLYGFPSCVAEFDGMEMPPLPRCPSYIHRYSTLWRDFDRGLYRFLVNYIYIPTLSLIKGNRVGKDIPQDIQKMMASFMTFVYVYIWHSLSFEVFVWTAFNFFGITIERFGSAIKREIDKRVAIDQLWWDFLVEPVVTVPLAFMSILNSSIFCGTMSGAISFSTILWKRRADSWVFFFMYCLTHTAVTYRTWGHKLSKLLSRIAK